LDTRACRRVTYLPLKGGGRPAKLVGWGSSEPRDYWNRSKQRMSFACQNGSSATWEIDPHPVRFANRPPPFRGRYRASYAVVLAEQSQRTKMQRAEPHIREARVARRPTPRDRSWAPRVPFSGVPIVPLVPIGAALPGFGDCALPSGPIAPIAPIGLRRAAGANASSFESLTRGNDPRAKPAAPVRANIFEYFIGHAPVIIELPDSIGTSFEVIHRTKNSIISAVAAKGSTRHAVHSLCWRAPTTTVNGAIAGPGSRSGTAGNSIGYASPDGGETLIGAASSVSVGLRGFERALCVHAG
jgi:hypothetical protein